MSAVSEFHERVEKAFEPTPRGVVGLVDDLLSLACEQGLALNWRDGRCRIRTLDAQEGEVTEISLQKSLFRAILARVAALCNEQMPDAASPYGGEGALTVGHASPAVLQVAFVNRPGTQQLEIRPANR